MQVSVAQLKGRTDPMPDATTAPKHPLPQGHAYGPEQGVLMWHSGRDNLLDRAGLCAWQRRYRSAWYSRLDVTGVYDGATQRAAVAVQRAAGLPVTGLIDRDTWEAVWTVQRPSRTPPEPAPEPVVPTAKRQTSREWNRKRQFAQAGIEYGTDPEAPPWWPGRLFGLGESGWHVRQVQDLLGLKATGIYNQDTARRVRGYQKMHAGLTVSGIVDLVTAQHLDPGPYDEP